MERRTSLFHAIASIAIICSVLAPHSVAHAQGAAETAAGFTTTAAGTAVGLVSLPATALWYLLVYLLKLLSEAFLFIASFFLDNIFFYNVVLNPNNMPAVQEAWSVMRDVANSLFILILLWIALTIILNIENLGGKKLLARVIVVALLINFSLAMVSAVFGFANALAIPFRSAIAGNGQEGVAALIVNKVGLQRVNQISNVDVKAEHVSDVNTECGFNTLLHPQDRPKDSNGNPIGCVQGDAASTFANSLNNDFFSSFNSVNRGAWKSILSMAISVIFLLLAVIAFIIASFSLLFRLVAMVFLSVLAPAAFIAAVIPVPGAKSIWEKWLKQLMCWAFYAPAFYFLFWVSLRILEAMTTGPLFTKVQSNFASYVFAMIPFLVFFTFLMASVRIGKKLGCQGAEMATDLGKKVGGLAVGLGIGAASGGASLLARTAASSLLAPGSRTGAAVTALSQRPILGKLTAPATRRATAYMESRREKVEEAKKGITNWSSDNLAVDISRTSSLLNPARKVAAAQILAERGELNKLSRAEQEDVVRLAGSQFGPASTLSFLKARPDLATPTTVPGTTTNVEAAQRVAQTQLKRQDDFVKISREAIVVRDEDSEAQKNLKEKIKDGIWFNPNFSATFLGQMASNDIEMARAVNDHLDNLIARSKNTSVPAAERDEIQRNLARLEDRFKDYLNGNLARGLGLRAPKAWEQTSSETTPAGSGGGAPPNNPTTPPGTPPNTPHP